MSYQSQVIDATIDLESVEVESAPRNNVKVVKIAAGALLAAACIGFATHASTSAVEPMFASVAVTQGVNLVDPTSARSKLTTGARARAFTPPRAVAPGSPDFSEIEMEMEPEAEVVAEPLLLVEDPVEADEATIEQQQTRTAGLFGGVAAVLFAVQQGLAFKNKDQKQLAMLSTSGSATEADSKMKLLKLGVLFFLWYALNIAYNITNKKVLNAVPLPWIQSCASLWMGVPLVLLFWLTGIRKSPELSVKEMGVMAPIAAMHAAGHLAAVVSFAWGAVSFTQIVKAAEPVFTAGLSGIFLGQVFHPLVYAALIPIIGGVAVASLGELSFSMMAFAGAMISNVTFAFRAILSKKLMGGKEIGKNMTTSNVYAVMTIMAAIITTPFAIWKEGAIISTAMATAAAGGVSQAYIIKNVVLSGLTFFLYNEVAFQALNQVNAVTHAVANTIKRVAIILASVVVFGTPMTPTGTLGSAIAIAGVLVYSLVKNKYPRGDYGQKKEIPAAPVASSTDAPPAPPATA